MNAFITHNVLNSLTSGAAAQGMPSMQQVQSHSLGEEKQPCVLAISCNCIVLSSIKFELLRNKLQSCFIIMGLFSHLHACRHIHTFRAKTQRLQLWYGLSISVNVHISMYGTSIQNIFQNCRLM